MTSSVACVVVGRNEGRRLGRCLETVLAQCERVVYVDSASTDGSPRIARSLGVDVVDVDAAMPLSAARGRNVGYRRVRQLLPTVELVQFVDGDCTLAPGWLKIARQAHEAAPRAAAVCGRLRELNRESSIYSRLCDMEWALPLGEVESCGGNMMVRAVAFEEVGGFDATLIAGEEPDLCARLRARGWTILSLPHEMGVHDAAMTRFTQWWRRSMRAGHAYAEIALSQGAGAKARSCSSADDESGRSQRHPAMGATQQVGSIVFWGLGLPWASLSMAPLTLGASLSMLTGYTVLYGRVYRRMRTRSASREDARLYALFCILGKFPQCVGLLRYCALKGTGRRSRLIEHKD